MTPEKRATDLRDALAALDRHDDIGEMALLVDAIREAVAEEREACAQWCEATALIMHDAGNLNFMAYDHCADAIRARGTLDKTERLTETSP